MSNYHRFNSSNDDDESRFLNTSGYAGQNSRYNASSDSINFQQPQAAAYSEDRYSRSHDHLNSFYNDEQSTQDYSKPTNIFSGAVNPPAPAFSPLPSSDNPFENAFGREDTSYGGNFDPNHQYEMNDFHDYNYSGNKYSNNPNFSEAFVPHVYDDEEERLEDQRIQYDQFEGDYYDLNTVHLPPTPAPASNSGAPVSRNITPHQPSLIDVPPPQSPFEMVAPPPPQSPFGNEFEYGEPPEEEPPREEIPDPEPQKALLISGINGHLVLDCPVADELLSKYNNYDPNNPDGGGLKREFSYMRYTAVTCGPSNFERDNYILRQVHYTPEPRQTELMVVVTMYNEDDILLARTLKGVFKNIKHLESRTRSSTWGPNSWKKVVVCVVSDGRSKINERAQALLAALGVYQAGLAKSVVDDRKVQAHMYEYTTRVGIASVGDTVKLTTEKIVPVQMLFCLKEKNAKKINSHRWCFDAIAKLLKPEVVVLLDAGTQPTGKSLYHLWKEFARNPQVAGACGEIKASLKKRQIATNPIVYAQNFEYKISNILDKPTESVFGFISVLPGAFSAYRYVALQNDVNGKGPLEKYFKGEFLHGGDLDPDDDEYLLKSKMLENEAGIFTSNMYLAEDRILCYELVAKRNCCWLLRYCKSASAETDVPEKLSEFILQRRRWLNGSFFAAIYSLAHFPKLWHSSHTFLRKLFLHIQFFYQLLNLIVSWFSIGSYFLVFRILTTSLAAKDLHFAPGKVLSVIFLWLYLASIVTTFVLSFGNTPKGTEKFYVVIVIFFAILMAYMIFAAIFMAVHAIQSIYDDQTKITVSLFFKNAEFRDLVVATSSTYALYFLASFIYFEPWHMFTSFIQYILLSPAYVNVLNIYAFCNIDDISWGTKGDVGAADLGAAVKKEDGSFDVNVPTEAAEINQCYLEELEKIKKPIDNSGDKYVPTHEDYYAFIRSMTVLVWMISNFVIIALVLETGGFNQFESESSLSKTKESRAEVFLTVILWLVAFMALYRFIGCVLYLIQRFVSKFKSNTAVHRQKV